VSAIPASPPTAAASRAWIAARALPRVVYLAGSGHSGSTLMALLMDCHPRIVSVGETAFKRSVQRRAPLSQTCSCGRQFLECEFWKAVFERVQENGYDMSHLRWRNDYRYAQTALHRALTEYSSYRPIRLLQQVAGRRLPIHAARMRRVTRVNVAFVRAVLAEKRADVFFDTSKRAVRLHHLLQCDELDMRVVRLYRDVRGYAASAKRRGQPVATAAQAWVRHQEILDEISAVLPADRVFRLRYEDLCRDPEASLRPLQRFCGVSELPAPHVIRAQDHHVLGNSMRLNEQIRIRLDESWRDRLAADEVDRILAIAGPANRAAGYV
jgi:hypothetical protein